MAKSSRDILTRSYEPERYKKLLGVTRELRADNTLVTTVPSLPFEALESPGYVILPWYVMKIFDSDIFTSYFTVDLDPDQQSKDPNQQSKDPDQQSKDRFVAYLVYHQIEFDLSFYDHDSPKHPLLIESKWKYSKTSSRSHIGVLRHPSRIKPYARAEYVGVRVDSITRKPIPFPESWKIRYGIPSTGTKSEHIFPDRNESTKVLTTEHRVSYSDMDENGHANYSFYTRSCYNSFAENLIFNKLNDEAERYFKNGPKKIQSTYLNECLMGDTVTVESWKDDNSSNVYYFIVRKGDIVCARLTFTFHKQSANVVAQKL